jgi:hypothetical protein
LNWTEQTSSVLKGFVYIMLRLTVGEVSFTIDMQLYLRASTVRRLNKERKPHNQPAFRSKIDIAQQMLDAVAPFIPAD